MYSKVGLPIWMPVMCVRDPSNNKPHLPNFHSRKKDARLSATTSLTRQIRLSARLELTLSVTLSIGGVVHSRAGARQPDDATEKTFFLGGFDHFSGFCF
ncbi:hypothetical protein CDAR_442071 [Caerostris darwini]|uniref:Uncharacterized protein n=1 Tax=Caerostris darwini TaxID=1538125 RepID=A0AAV4V0N2_9ARAC|nr:hypothetical protein CDAR_442071 [Caerostris darwini]